MSSSKPFRLTARDINVLASVAAYRFLSSQQIATRHFHTITHRTLTDPTAQAQSQHRTATNRLSQLHTHGFISRVFAYPKATDSPTGRPAAVYYLTKTNLNAIQHSLVNSHRADLFDAFLDHTIDAKQFSPYFLIHELAISEFFLILEEAAAKRDETRVLFWERLSPRVSDVSERFEATITRPTSGGKTTTRKIVVHFNPDAFFCYRDETGASFFFLEYDNNTESAERYQYKLGGYLVYRNRKAFPKLLNDISEKYRLGIPQEMAERLSFKVLTLTPTESRRNTLLRVANQLTDAHLFLFASTTDLTVDTILEKVWLSASAYDPIAAEEKMLSQNIKTSIKNNLITERIARIERVPFM